VSAPTLTQTLDQLRAALAAYIEATYHLRDERLLRQRAALMEQPGVIAQVPFVEVLPQYRSLAEAELFARGGDAPLPSGAREALSVLAATEERDGVTLARRVFPPYVHQLHAVRAALGTHPDHRGERKSLVVTTGTGSGKTECFLMPILGALAAQAHAARRGGEGRKKWETPAVRVVVLYPMNALVNDQLGRLRGWLGDPRIVDLFRDTWNVRPVRFARYTSRTPYPGLRRVLKGRAPDGSPLRTPATNRVQFKCRDKARLAPRVSIDAARKVKTIESFYCFLEDQAERARQQQALGNPLDEELARDLRLWRELKELGKWPSKESLREWIGYARDNNDTRFRRTAAGAPTTQRRWFRQGAPLDGREDRPRYATVGDRDSELYSRHEVQDTPPDVLVTNYSMLEYMLMRPMERGIFDQTRRWLRDHKDERLLLVVDEAHLYRGTSGAEVALLLRRLRQRLGIGPERLQVIVTSASFSSKDAAKEFAAELTGTDKEQFVALEGAMVPARQRAPLREGILEALAGVDRGAFEDLGNSTRERAAAVRPLLALLDPPLADPGAGGSPEAWADLMDGLDEAGAGALERHLYGLLDGLGAVERLRAVAMPRQGDEAEVNVAADEGRAAGPRPLRPVPEEHNYEGRALCDLVFEDAGSLDQRERALSALLSLASAARRGGTALLPSRAHAFFRGLPGLWVCADPGCSLVDKRLPRGVAGKLYASDPGPTCGCGARVFPLYTCRDCGATYLRAYTAARPKELLRDGASAAASASGGFLWSVPGDKPRVSDQDDEEQGVDSGGLRPLEPLDLMLPRGEVDVDMLEGLGDAPGATPLDLSVTTGRLRPGVEDFEDLERPWIRVYGAPGAGEQADEDDGGAADGGGDGDGGVGGATRPGQVAPCLCCAGSGFGGRSTVMDHVTKGAEPLATLVGAQLQSQRARLVEGESDEERRRRIRFAPLEGRKVLVFSDSRQKAAGLSMKLNTFTARDVSRVVFMQGWARLVREVGYGGEWQQRMTGRHGVAAQLVGEHLTNRPLRPPPMAGQETSEGLRDTLQTLLYHHGGPTPSFQPLQHGALQNLEQPGPNGSWDTLVYGTLVGSRVRIAADGSLEPTAARLGQLNRAQSLTSLALAHLAPHPSLKQQAREAVPDHRCPHGAEASCDVCRDQLVARWLVLVAMDAGINLPPVTTQAWVNQQQSVRTVREEATTRSRLGRALEAALSGTRQYGLDADGVRSLHRNLRALFVENLGYLSGEKLSLWSPSHGTPWTDQPDAWIRDPCLASQDPGTGHQQPAWCLCDTCGTVLPSAPSAGSMCPQCGQETLRPIRLQLSAADPGSGALEGAESDPRVRWFASRKQLYRAPVVRVLLGGEAPFAPVAAEHTAQVGDAPQGEVFSPAETHELLFQDVEVGQDHRGRRRPAVDILSSTTTMEVGIDIGSLSGVALRNMPPRRDNYQQRAGRAGRRGDGVATVVGYANTGSHDTHAYERPETLLSDAVADPTLALDNVRVARRHATATLLQVYAHEQLEGQEHWESPQLFEVLGRLSTFLDPSNAVSLDGFRRWLDERSSAELFDNGGLVSWALEGLDEPARVDFRETLVEHAQRSVEEAIRQAQRRRDRGGLTGETLPRRLLERTQRRVGPILDWLRETKGSLEQDWLELKAVIVPPGLAAAETAKYRWHVAKAALTLRNSRGGVLLIGVGEVAQPGQASAPVPADPREPSGPGGIGTLDFEGWCKRQYRPALEGEPRWSDDRGRSLRTSPDSTLVDLGDPQPCSFQGHPVAAVFIAPAASPERLVFVERAGLPLLPHRKLGARGEGELLERTADIEDAASGAGLRGASLAAELQAFDAWWDENQGRYLAVPETPAGWHPEQDPAAGTDADEDQGEGEETLKRESATSLEASVEALRRAAGDEDSAPGAAAVSAAAEESSDGGADTSARRATQVRREAGRPTSDDPDLLRLLIDQGVLPSYAFPTAVVPFQILDQEQLTKRGLPRTLYSASQGMEQALSQYAPGRMVYLDNQTWHVGALYDSSPRQRDRREAYKDRQTYLHCPECGHYTDKGEDGEPLRKEDLKDADYRPTSMSCQVCGAEAPLRHWFRPTGFLHVEPERPETALAPLSFPTKAQLVVPRPQDGDQSCERRSLEELKLPLTMWHRWRAELVVLNEGAQGKGYVYCPECGRVEPSQTKPASSWRKGPHTYPYLERGPRGGQLRKTCNGTWVRRDGRLALGHQFETDVLLLKLDAASVGLTLRPRDPEARGALLSLKEAIRLAASERVLQLQRGELDGGYRWPGGDAGKLGHEVELYLFDRVPGGAGYADDIARDLPRVLKHARELLECPRGCGTSCYSCLRRYSNQLEHARLDRHLALFLLDAIEQGAPPAEWGTASHWLTLRQVATDAAAQVEGATVELSPEDLGLPPLPRVAGPAAPAKAEGATVEPSPEDRGLPPLAGVAGPAAPAKDGPRWVPVVRWPDGGRAVILLQQPCVESDGVHPESASKALNDFLVEREDDLDDEGVKTHYVSSFQARLNLPVVSKRVVDRRS